MATEPARRVHWDGKRPIVTEDRINFSIAYRDPTNVKNTWKGFVSLTPDEAMKLAIALLTAIR